MQPKWQPTQWLVHWNKYSDDGNVKIEMSMTAVTPHRDSNLDAQYERQMTNQGEVRQFNGPSNAESSRGLTTRLKVRLVAWLLILEINPAGLQS